MQIYGHEYGLVAAQTRWLKKKTYADSASMKKRIRECAGYVKKLCSTEKYGGEGGIRTLGTGYPVRRLSKPVHSTTLPPLRSRKDV